MNDIWSQHVHVMNTWQQLMDVIFDFGSMESMSSQKVLILKNKQAELLATSCDGQGFSASIV